MPVTVAFDNLWCCVDCILLIANGETSDGTDPDALGERIASNWPTGNLVPEGPHDDETEGAHVDSFSWSECDACGSTLGGERHRISRAPASAEPDPS